MYRCIIAGLLLLVTYVAALPKRYDGYEVLSFTPTNMKQLRVLDQLEHIPEVNFWHEASFPGVEVTLSVAPEWAGKVKGALLDHQVAWQVVQENLQHLLDVERVLNMKDEDNFAFDYNKYNRHSEINEQLEALASKYSFCELLTIGKSYEGRDMKLLKIGGPSTQQAVFIDGGIHAREWISPASSMFLIQQLTEGYEKDASIKALVDRITWYILPVLNPDGYEYSHTQVRLWRKTRAPYFLCDGADANRNFDFHWNEGGASDNPCSETFAGPEAFSEIEARNLATFLGNKKLNIGVYIALHSYGQLWLTPWGYTRDLPQDYQQLAGLANVATAAIKRVSGRVYRVGSSTRILYVASGGADDWAKGVAGIKYSYTVELRDKGNNGFVLPPTEIQPTGEELFAGLQAMVNQLWPQQ